MITPKKTNTLAKLYRNQKLLYFALFTLVVIIIWVIGSIVAANKRTGIEPELLKMAIPLNPNIDTAAISKIESKRKFEQPELENFEILKLKISEDDSRNLRFNQNQGEAPLGDLIDQASGSAQIVAPAPTPAASASAQF